MTWAGYVNHVQIKRLDYTIQMNIDKVLPGGGPPMTEQRWLDMRSLQRLLEQWVVVQIDLPDGQVVCRTPIRIHLLQDVFIRLWRLLFRDSTHFYLPTVC